MKCVVAPSMMCVPVERTAEYLRAFEETGVEYLHVDVMDGCFVPNYTLGVDYVKRLRQLTTIPLDVHLMIERPEDKIGWFDFQPDELVSVHAESTRHLQRALRRIADTGAKPLAALNPATPLCQLDYVLDDAAGVLVMTVNPGFAGQKAVPAAIRKIADARSYMVERGRVDGILAVDGNVSYERIPEMRRNGANLLVLGTSSVLGAKENVADAIRRLRGMLE